MKNRVCLRNVSPNNLQQLNAEYESKLQNILNITVHRDDPHQEICVNCSNLLCILHDYKEASRKAATLLLTTKQPLKTKDGDVWDHPDRVAAIALSKQTVEDHLRIIETVSTSKTSQHNQTINSLSKESGKFEYTLTNESNRDKYDDCADHVPPKKRITSKKCIDNDGTGARRGRKPKDQPEFMAQLCDFCGKRVCGESAEGHKNQHLGIQPYSCPVSGCSLTFYGRYNRLRHVKRMHSEAGVQVHSCNVCGKTIRGPDRALKYHLQRHEQNQRNQKNFVCQVCNKGFTLQRYLSQHAVTHSGEFPHKCSYCGKKFNNKWGMRTHEKNIHEKRNQLIKEGASPENTVQRTPPQ